MSTQRQRRRFSSEFKAKVALAAIKNDETLSELSKRFGIHSNQILKWKRDFLSNAGAAFDRKNEFEALEKERDRLYKKVGQLEMEKDFLKKNLNKLGL